MRIMIAGAGIGGLSAALGFLQKGYDVEVYEQATELKELGAGLAVSMNGVRVLHSYGLEDALREVNLEAADRVVRLWNTGHSWSIYDRGAGAKDHRIYVLLRAELHRILADAVRKLKPDAIRLSSRCVGFEQNAQGVTALFENGNSARGEILVGADGVHSKVRQAAFGPTEGKYTGALAWRGLVPLERLPDEHRRPIATTWIGPRAHITSYPMRRHGEGIVSFSAQVDRDNWELESWSSVGTISECLTDFSGWHPQVIEMIANVEVLYKWGLFVRDPLPHWSKGRVTLLGDACHSMVPYLGQGVNMAIEDGCVLARCVDKYRADPEAALLQYEKARAERTNKAAARSAAMQATFHHPSLARPDTAAPYIEKTWARSEVKARFDWLFEYDATQVAI